MQLGENASIIYQLVFSDKSSINLLFRCGQIKIYDEGQVADFVSS